MMKAILVMSAGLLMADAVFAALEPQSPVKGELVSLVPDVQKAVMKLSSIDERIKLLAENRERIGDDKYWRKALPLVLKVKTTEGETGPWKVLIGKRLDLSDARVWYLKTTMTDKVSGREEKSEGPKSLQLIEVPMANLEIATTYYWKIVCRGRCGFGCSPKHGCDACGRLSESPVASFRTEDFAPRWIELEGRVENVRDFGGRIGLDGRRVRQGMIYRGQAFNDNSLTGETQGRNRLTVEDVKYLTGILGIRTDLDLRGYGEIVDMKDSPLGPRATFINNPSECYREIFKRQGKKAMAKNFRLLCDRKNYPIYFHCIGGADRTGSLAYVMNGVLGVSQHEAETDWESTFYPNIPDANPNPKFWCRESHFNSGLARYGDANTPWNRRIVLYLKDCGITDEEIDTFREIMLETK